MKNILPLTLALAIPAFAGTPTPVAPAPAPAPTLTEWFVGGSFGQFYGVEAFQSARLYSAQDVDLNMFTLQFGRDFCPVAGFDMAAYLEVGYLYGDFNTVNSFPAAPLAVKYDLDLLPVTMNLKFEHKLVGGLGAYLSGGLGYAWSSIKPQGGHENNDGGFYAQAAAGLVYNFCPNFELFGGARWIYINEVDVAGAPLADSNAFGWEAGLRYNF